MPGSSWRCSVHRLQAPSLSRKTAHAMRNKLAGWAASRSSAAFTTCLQVSGEAPDTEGGAEERVLQGTPEVKAAAGGARRQLGQNGEEAHNAAHHKSTSSNPEAPAPFHLLPIRAAGLLEEWGISDGELQALPSGSSSASDVPSTWARSHMLAGFEICLTATDVATQTHALAVTAACTYAGSCPWVCRWRHVHARAFRYLLACNVAKTACPCRPLQVTTSSGAGGSCGRDMRC